MEEVAEWAVEGLKWLVAIGGAVGAIYGWVVTPIKKMQAAQNAINQRLAEDLKKLNGQMEGMQEDVADLLRERLRDIYRHYMKIGWCTSSEKQYYIEMHQRYTAKGHNHLAERYQEDLLSLPEKPPKEEPLKEGHEGQ